MTMVDALQRKGIGRAEKDKEKDTSELITFCQVYIFNITRSKTEFSSFSSRVQILRLDYFQQSRSVDTCIPLVPTNKSREKVRRFFCLSWQL